MIIVCVRVYEATISCQHLEQILDHLTVVCMNQTKDFTDDDAQRCLAYKVL